MAQESGDGKKDSSHILSLFLFCFVLFCFPSPCAFSCVLFHLVSEFSSTKELSLFFESTLLCSVFFLGGIRGKGVSVKSMILQGSKLHFETPNPRGSGALVYCCNNFLL